MPKSMHNMTVSEIDTRMRQLRRPGSKNYRKDGYMRAVTKRELQSLGAVRAGKTKRRRKKTTKRRRR